MSIFINDTARNNLCKWTIDGLKNKYAIGAYLSPFTSPRSGGKKKNPKKVSEEILAENGEFWFDSTTYALSIPRNKDLCHYNTWNLWNNSGVNLTSIEALKDHIKRVYNIQEELGSPLLAPTTLVSNPDSLDAQKAIELSHEAIKTASSSAWLTIAGDQQFWSCEASLDAYIGALDQLEPKGWLLVVTRENNSMPPNSTPEEIHGIMRTTFALSQDRPVRVAFGDIAALPAVAAGAEAIGTGWDMRQRICAYQNFEKRNKDSKGGGWYQRPTLLGLMGGISKGDYELLESESRQLAQKLSPGSIGPYPQQAFRHHANCLTEIVEDLKTLSGPERVLALRDRYINARPEWVQVKKITRDNIGPERWITPFLDGIDLFMATEGWR